MKASTLLPVLLATAPLAQESAVGVESYVYDEPFFPDAGHDPRVPTPDSILGHRHASRLSHHEEILACFERWVESSPRITVQPYGLTHEGRELVYAVITSPENHARLSDIRADLDRLFDPRGLTDAEAERIVTGTPAVAWLGYSIHGDETSGADASVAFGYHLVAGTDPAVTELLERVVVVIDPVMNPDGRERIIGMVEQQTGRATSLDWESMHRGRWPYGRGNHYLFDMNRDWMAGTQPETRGRWRAVLSFRPQLFVDAHEMGSLDTFLFYPQEKPHNPFLPAQTDTWQRAYGAGIARAFDEQGWDYYTREWADGWGPFYSDAWGSLIGATGILYEQARTFGTPLRRASGKILTYREAVHHQTVASLANVEVLAQNREAVLRDYLADKRSAVAEDTPGNDRAFVFAPDGRRSRAAELLRILLDQDVEVFRATEGFTASGVDGHLGTSEEGRELPAGTWIVPARQPQRALVRAFLDFDTRMDKEALVAERTDLERKGQTRIYDLSAWSLPHAFDLDAFWVDAPDVATEIVSSADLPPAPQPAYDAADPPVAWIVDGREDTAVAFALQAMELGLRVHASDEPFRSAGRSFARGSIVVRRHENEGSVESLDARVRRAGERSRAEVVPTTSSRSPDDGPDLGGGHFHLLARPRIALVSNMPVAADTYGHVWHYLDRTLGAPLAILDAQTLGSYDLRRYNVLVLPRSWGGMRAVLEPLKDELEAWVRGGGTLVACGNSAGALTSGQLGLSAVTLRRDALEDLEGYARQAARERAARTIEVDEAVVWGDASASADEEGSDAGDEGAEEASDEEGPDAELDRWMRRFAPHGVTLRGIVDEVAWITSGADGELPVFSSGSQVLLSKAPVRTAVRLADAPQLRLGGLVWPEARERLAESAWLTVERKGDGQIVLFAAMPAYRGYHHASARLLGNAVVLGPGMGTRQPVGW